ncbi:MAG: hypothetical protein ACTSRH_00190 [Promethearchaeota archaeon]
MSQDNNPEASLRAKLEMKEKQLIDFQEELKEKNDYIELLKKSLEKFEDKVKQIKFFDEQLKVKDDLINNLQNSLKLKDDQINTLKDSLKLKDEQIETLENSLSIKEEKIETLEKTIKLKEEKIKQLEESTIDKDLFEEKDEEIKKLKEKLEILKEELEKADEDLEALEKENEVLRNQLAAASGAKIIDWTNVEIPKSLILEKMREILNEAVHNVTIAVPDIKDLQELHLYDLRSSVSMKVSCSLNPGLEEDAELLEELESLDNISIRLYEGQDRYLIERDGEELMFAIIGNEENNHLVLHTRDPKHLKLLRSLVMESWLRSRKIE